MDLNQLSGKDLVTQKVESSLPCYPALESLDSLRVPLRVEEDRLLEWIDQLEEREPFVHRAEGAQISSGEEAWRDWKNELRRRAAQISLPGVHQLEETARSAIVSASAQQGKRIRFKSLSADDSPFICLDPSTHEILRSALVHLVRNAVTHGIESPVERQARGKPAEGVISLCLTWSQGGFLLELSDDGRGLQEDRIREQASKAGVSAARTLPLEELVFHPKVSARDSSEKDIWAGTAVGLDAVRSTLRDHGGDITAHAQAAGRGALFRIRIRPYRFGLNVVRFSLKNDKQPRTFYMSDFSVRDWRGADPSEAPAARLADFFSRGGLSAFAFERFIRGPQGVSPVEPQAWLASILENSSLEWDINGESEFRLFQRAEQSWAAKIPKGAPGYGYQLGLAPLLDS
jgi:hypothetical protein